MFYKKFGRNWLNDRGEIDRFWNWAMKECSDINNENLTYKGDIVYNIDDSTTMIELEVPGFTPETLKISFSNDILSVKGEREAKYGTLTVKKTIDKVFSVKSENTIEAEMKDGILYITIRKPIDRVEVKNIEIKC